MTNVTLTVEFLNSKRVGKVLVKKLSGNRYNYSGKTKSECIKKAKDAYRYGASYINEWKIEQI